MLLGAMGVAPDGSPVGLYARLPELGEGEAVAAALPAGASVLELGCGTGRITRQLVRLGHRVTAVHESGGDACARPGCGDGAGGDRGAPARPSLRRRPPRQQSRQRGAATAASVPRDLPPSRRPRGRPGAAAWLVAGGGREITRGRPLQAARRPRRGRCRSRRDGVRGGRRVVAARLCDAGLRRRHRTGGGACRGGAPARTMVGRELVRGRPYSSRASSACTRARATSSRARFAGSLSQPLSPDEWGSGTMGIPCSS